MLHWPAPAGGYVPWLQRFRCDGRSGEIHYPFVLAAPERAGCQGYVGLEYTPGGTTDDSLAWLPRAQRGWQARSASLDVPREEKSGATAKGG